MLKILSTASIFLMFATGVFAQINNPATEVTTESSESLNMVERPQSGTLLINFYEIEGDTAMTTVNYEHHYVPAFNVKGALLQDGETLFTFDNSTTTIKQIGAVKDEESHFVMDQAGVSTVQFNDVSAKTLEIVAEDPVKGYYGNAMLDINFDNFGIMEVNMLLSQDGLVQLPKDMSELESPEAPAVEQQTPPMPPTQRTQTAPMSESARRGVGAWGLLGLGGLAGLAGLSPASPVNP